MHCAAAVRVGVVTDPPLQESISDPQTLLDALEEPSTEPLTLTAPDSDASSFCFYFCHCFSLHVHCCGVA